MSSNTAESEGQEKKMLRLQVDDLQKRMDMMKDTFDREKLRWKSEIEGRKLEENQRNYSLEESIFQLKSQVSNERAETRRNMRENARLASEIEDFLVKVSDRSGRNISTFDDVLSLFDDLEQKRESEAKRFREIDSRCFALSQENEALEKQNKKKNQKIKAIKSACEETMRKQDRGFETELQHMRKEMKKQGDVISKMAAIIEKLKKENESLKRKSEAVADLEAQLEDQKKNSVIPVLEGQKAVLESRLDEANGQIDIQLEKIQELNDAAILSNEQLERQVELIKELKAENKSLSNSLENTRARSKDKSTKIRALEKTIRTLETNEISLQAEISELKLKVATVQTEARPSPTKEVTAVRKDGPDFGNAMTSLEECLRAQAEEITALQQQRSALIETVKKLEVLLTRTGKFGERLEVQVGELTNALSEEKKASQKAMLAFHKNEEEILSEIRVMLPTSVDEKVEELRDCSFADHVVGVVRVLVENIEEANDPDLVHRQQTEAKPRIDPVLLSHLSSACGLLRRLAGTIDSGYDKDQILKECARIGAFVDEHGEELANCPSLRPLFDLGHSDMTSVAQVFHNMVSDPNACRVSPFNELYILFCCLVHINKILVNEFEDLEARNKTLLRKVANIDDAEERLLELEEWKRKQEEEMNSVHAIFSKLVDHPSENVLTLAGQVCRLIEWKDAELAKAMENARKEQIIEENNKEIEKLKKAVQRHKIHKKRFCKEATEVTAEIREDVVRLQEDYADQIEAAEQKIENLNELNTTTVLRYKEKIENLKEEIAVKDEQNEVLGGQVHQLKKEINALFAKCSSQDNEILAFKEQVATLEEQLSRAISHKNHYKQKVQSEEKRDSETLQELQEKTTELKTKYEAIVSELTTELATSKQALHEARSACSKFEQIKQSLMHANAKLSLSERTLGVKLASTQAQLENERSIHASKETALKHSYEANLQNQQAEFNKDRALSIALLRTCALLLFEHDIPESVTLPELHKLVTTALESRDTEHELQMTRDATEARKLLHTSTLTSSIKELLQTQSSLRRDIESLVSENKSITASMSRLRADTEWREQTIGDCTQWISWAKALLIQLSEGAPIPETSVRLRRQIEDVLINTVSKRRLLRKVEILRKEKRLLSSKPGLLKQTPTQSTTSLRPITIALALALRLKRNASHCFV